MQDNPDTSQPKYITPSKNIQIDQQEQYLLVTAKIRSYTSILLILLNGYLLKMTLSSSFGFASILSLIVSLGIGALGIRFVFGKVQIKIYPTHLEIFSGVGKIGKTKQIAFEDIYSVKHAKHEKTASVKIEGSQPIGFGSELTDRQRAFITTLLQQKIPDLQNEPDDTTSDWSSHLID